MSEKKEIPTGVVGLILTALGAGGRIWVMSIASQTPRGGVESASDTQLMIGGLSAILLLVGGIVSIMGAVKGDQASKGAGIAGAFIAGVFILIFLGQLSG